ncbi:hypothetical protein BDN72DRAFT_883549 [Pluteus cervinus]|uniref:Uncharacterized protein n=1 Tax=Pluteus cervinus TaxID=181527 RepID=A0ACD3A3U6_9AGAR|nr:hypothetical protein BDN72DRAFT_883549 [Pluteus cervinus]
MSFPQQLGLTVDGGSVLGAQPQILFDNVPSLCSLLGGMDINTQSNTQKESNALYPNNSTPSSPSSIASEPEFAAVPLVEPQTFLDENGVPPQIMALAGVYNAAMDIESSFPPCLLTSSELHEAKLLILELLSWGVPPEYLVAETGVSAGTIYRVFTDLNLRLPTNLVF